VVATKAPGETFGGASIAREVNQRYGKRLRHPAQARTVATACAAWPPPAASARSRKEERTTRRCTREGMGEGLDLLGSVVLPSPTPAVR